jgi:hypothetical protein
MVFPTIRDCRNIRGAKRELLYDFDRSLREAIARTGLKACSLDADDGEIGMACVTVLMTVAASLAFDASDSPANIEASHFSNAAEEAFTWAKNRLNGRENRRSPVRGIFSPRPAHPGSA